MKTRRLFAMDERARLDRAADLASRRASLFARLEASPGAPVEAAARRIAAEMDLKRLRVDIARLRMRLGAEEG
jgi:predicted aminopeptidase